MKSFFLSFDHLLSHTITATLTILNTLQIVDLGRMIVGINISRATIFIIPTTTTTTTAVNHKEKSVMFVAKKVVFLISIQTISNEEQNNFGDETKNSVKIKINTIHFWLIIKGIQMMTLMMSIKKQIIQRTMTKIVSNMLWLHIFNESFMHFSMAQDTLLSNEGNGAEHFVLVRYTVTLFQGIIPDIGVAKI